MEDGLIHEARREDVGSRSDELGYTMEAWTIGSVEHFLESCPSILRKGRSRGNNYEQQTPAWCMGVSAGGILYASEQRWPERPSKSSRGLVPRALSSLYGEE